MSSVFLQAKTVEELSDHAATHQDEPLNQDMEDELFGESDGDDHDLLKDEEEGDELLAAHRKLPDQRVTDSASVQEILQEHKSIKRRQRRARKKARRRGKHDEEGKLMFEMEEGIEKGDALSISSSNTSDSDPKELDDSVIRRGRRRRRLLIFSAIAALFCFFAFGAYRASQKHLWPHQHSPKLLSNGTSLFAPTTILISLDGFRADFLERSLTPILTSFISLGVSPKYMLPSFPSLTFPNHYTLVTGLHPESHGIVSNSFWAPEIGEEFYYTDPARSMQPKWWAGGEPLWATAEMQGVKTAIHMWPGSEAHIMGMEPTFLDKFNKDEPLPRKVDRILGLLDLPASVRSQSEQNSTAVHYDDASDTRPQLIAAYVPVVDSDGHLHGPNSTEIRGTITDVDNMLGSLFTGLNQRNLTNIVNIVIVSDHGMATTSTKRLIQLDDLIDLNLIEHIDGWPLYGLRPKNPSDLPTLYQKLKSEAASNPNFDVYLRDKDMPLKFHFSKNNRIAPLWVIPKAGWAIVHKADFDVKEALAKGETYHPKGLHGYDHEHPLMRAIFVARGPAFPHKSNSKLRPFQNTEVYNIVCDSLGIEPKANNGTLRLPLKPEGLHSDKDKSGEEDEKVVDLPSDEEAAAIQHSKEVEKELNATKIQELASEEDASGKGDPTIKDRLKELLGKIKETMKHVVQKIKGLGSS